MIIVGQGALARPDGGAILAAAWRLAAHVGALIAGLARLQRAAHRGRRASARWILVLCPARTARRRGRCWAAASICSGCSAPTSSTRRASRRDVRRLPGPSRRRRRAAGGRDPARRRLHGKIRHLRQHRGAGATRLHGGLSARRGARGLDDHARASARSSARPCRMTRSKRCARGWSRSIRYSAASASCRASAAPTTPARSAIRRC